MKSAYLDIFLPPGSSGEAELTFVGKREGDELLDGEILAGAVEVGTVSNGIAVLVDTTAWPPSEIEKARKENWIPENWTRLIGLAGSPPLKELCDEIASVAAAGELILEVAAGPAGGNLAPILHRNPGARMIVNDLSPRLLELWQEFLAERKVGENVCFAAFDATKMPVRSESVDAVSNRGGLSNIRPSQDAIREACRVLKPGGRVFSCELVLEREGLSKLPEGMQRRMSSEAIVRGMVDCLEAEGLVVEWHEIGHRRDLVPEEGMLPAKAARYGVTLSVTYEYVKARKPLA